VSTYQLDATGLLCPLPVIRTQDRVATLKQGDVLSVHCTDPGALLDIPAWCRIHGHELLSTQESEEEVLICIRVRK
jgi:tRNA 2-thiouridine synthesizing protein A